MLVGRERQLRELRDHVDGLGRGRGGLVLIGGEAGIGKTRLAEEALLLAAAAGVDARRVTCWAEAGAPPFWPWSQLLRDITTGQLDLPDHDVDPELARFRLFTSVADALRAAAGERPRLFVLDDLHWADQPSVHLLAFLAPRLTDTAVVIVVTYRDNELEASAAFGALLPELVRHGRRVAVPPLDRAQVGAFVADLHGNAVAEDLVTRLHALTAGNPLFTREVVSLLEVQGELARTAPAELPVPDSVRATLTRRLDMVSPNGRDALGVAAVAGVEFGVDVICEATTFDEATLLDLIDEAVRAQLVRDAGGGRFAFSHPLIRETAYRELGLARRVRLHRDVAEALERLLAKGTNVDPAELAHHFRNASAGGNADKAIEYAQAAGRRAMAMLAYEAAVDNYAQALQSLALCPPDPALECDLLLECADARVAAGDLPGARVAYSRAAALARAHGWPERLARAALGFGTGAGGFEVAPFDNEQIGRLREALAVVAADELHTRAMLLARLSVALSLGEVEAERLSMSEEAIALARRAGDATVLAYALSAHCDAIPGPEHSERRRIEAGEIITLAQSRENIRMELLGRRLRLVSLCELGEFVEVDTEIEVYARLAEGIRQPLYGWYVPLWRGMRALMEGRVEDATRFGAAAEAAGAACQSDNAEMLTMSLRLAWLWQAGFVEDAYQCTIEMFRLRPEIAAMTRPGLAVLAAQTGRREEAVALLDRMAHEEFAPRSLGSEWLPVNAFVAEAVWRVGGHTLAPELYDRLLPYRHLMAVDGIGANVHGSVELPLGMLAAVLGRPDDAREHFDAALAVHRRFRAELLVQRTLEVMGTALSEDAVPAPPVVVASAPGGAFRREGEVWALSFGGRSVRVRHSKGIADLAQLLAQPGRELHALDLVADGPVVAAGHSGERLDDQARDAYKRRLSDLEGEIDDADAAADADRSERLHAERDALLAELSGAYGLGGRPRRVGDPAERARSAVTQRIRDALGRIEAEHPDLGRHLRRSVRTGTFLAYEPDSEVTWDVGLTS